MFTFTANDLKRTIWAFVAAFLGVFVTQIEGPLHELAQSCQAATGCDWSTAEAALIAAGTAAVVAGFVALKNLILADDNPLKG